MRSALFRIPLNVDITCCILSLHIAKRLGVTPLVQPDPSHHCTVVQMQFKTKLHLPIPAPEAQNVRRLVPIVHDHDSQSDVAGYACVISLGMTSSRAKVGEALQGGRAASTQH